LFAETDSQFAMRIYELLNDPERRAALARRARAWACANLGWDGVIAAHEAVHDSLLARSES
jgi:hypothetical protein